MTMPSPQHYSSDSSCASQELEIKSHEKSYHNEDNARRSSYHSSISFNYNDNYSDLSLPFLSARGWHIVSIARHIVHPFPLNKINDAWRMCRKHEGFIDVNNWVYRYSEEKKNFLNCFSCIIIYYQFITASMWNCEMWKINVLERPENREYNSLNENFTSDEYIQVQMQSNPRS